MLSTLLIVKCNLKECCVDTGEKVTIAVGDLESSAGTTRRSSTVGGIHTRIHLHVAVNFLNTMLCVT